MFVGCKPKINAGQKGFGQSSGEQIEYLGVYFFGALQKMSYKRKIFGTEQFYCLWQCTSKRR